MENNENNNVVETTENTGTQPVETKVEKTFTQSEFEEALRKEVARKTKNNISDEDLKEFKNWKESQKTESDKMNELQTNNNTLTSENKYLKAQIEVNDSDVKKEFRKFVTSEVMSMVDDTTDFATALKNYKKDNPQYFGELQVKKVQTSPNLNGGANQPQTTNSIMNNILRGNR